MKQHIARVMVNLSLDRTFDYVVPNDLVKDATIGSMVRVPFGNSSRNGFIVGLPNFSKFDKLKAIQAVVSERALLPGPLLKLGEWMADYYCCSHEQAVHGLLPAVVRDQKIGKKKRKKVYLVDDIDLADILIALETRAPRQAVVVKFLVQRRSSALSRLLKTTGADHSVIKSMVKKGIVRVEEEVQERSPFSTEKIVRTQPLDLTSEQQAVFEQITKCIDAGGGEVVLISGVTGSGKTEVYLQAIAKCLDRGQEAIVLVPEIALTPQTIERFRGRFGDEISVLHSHLSAGERFDEWNKINEGRVKIAVGARSALFAPFQQLGLIVVDEEHETSYKQDSVPRYHARDVAVVRGKFENAVVVLGTATPSFESYYNTRVGKYVLARLTKRVDEQKMPRMEVVDMCNEAMASGRPQILSKRLISLTRNILEAGEQAMFFLNRRGYATQMQCTKCGYVAECEECSVNYTYHRKAEQLICHICGSVRRAPDKCPECKDAGIRYSGLGTEKVEAAVRKTFRNARVHRMDSDTMTRKESYKEVLTAFRVGEIDILIGTQMIAKGLHFPNVTLVGIIFADLTLNMPDFRAGERTFQLLVQVAGRAGRGDVQGRVVVQTYTPHHTVLTSALNHDFEAYYESEISSRMQLELPPYSHMLLIQFKGPEEAEASGAADLFRTDVASRLPEGMKMTPVRPSPILKKRGLFHYQILCYGKRIVSLSRIIKEIKSKSKLPKSVVISVDVDPYSMI